MSFVSISDLTRKMPPAVFPCIMGAMGLALAWRTGGEVLGVGPWVHYALSAITVVIYLMMLVLYMVKLMRRPSVFLDEIKTIPGRMGLAAMALTLMLLAITLVPIAPGLAQSVLVLAFLGHVIVALGALHNITTGGADARRVTPVWHLTFVGLIIASHSAVPLEFTPFALVLFVVTFLAALAIYGASLEQIKVWTMPVPMRPALVIHLAPVSLFGITSVLLGLQTVSMLFGWFSTAIFVVILIRLKWLMAAGFTPFWAAFTFPVASYAGLMLVLGNNFDMFRWIGIVTLLATTLYIPVIVVRIVRMCLDGRLSTATKAAEA